MLPAITVGSKLLALISHWLLVPALVDAVVEEMELEDIEFVLYYDGNWELSYLYKMLYLNFVFMLNIQPLSRSKKKKRLDCGQNQIGRLAKGDVLHKQSTSKKFETRN